MFFSKITKSKTGDFSEEPIKLRAFEGNPKYNITFFQANNHYHYKILYCTIEVDNKGTAAVKISESTLFSLACSKSLSLAYKFITHHV
jgi:hypothetical protein